MTQKDKVKELVGRGLHSYHTKALQQMDRIEKKNKEQSHKISILSNELDNDYLTKTEEGSVVSLEHSKEGMIYLDELQGNTLVNYCTDGSKEMTLNGDIDVEGTFVTTTEGVDNGKVDVLCEGNTLILDENGNEVEAGSEGARLVSVGQDDENGHKIEILSRNKNLWNVNEYGLSTGIYAGVQITKLENGFKLNGTSTSSFTRHSSTNYLDIFEKGKTYILMSEYFNFEITYANGTKNWRKLVTVTDDVVKVTCYLQWLEKIITFDNLILTPQIEEGSVATSYLAPSLNKKEILLNEPLRALPNGIKDRFVKIGSKWYIERNCKQLLINGLNELGDGWDWHIASTDNNITRFFLHPYSVKKQGFDNIICDKMPTNDTYAFTEGVAGYDLDGRIYVKLLNTKASNVSELKTYLSQNNLKVIFELNTPIYEPLEIEPTLNTYTDVTHISNDSLIPCNMKIQNTGYNAIIKPSTLYTIALDANKSGTIGMNLGGTKGTTTNNVLTLTTPATLTDDSLRLYGKGLKGSKVRLLEGDKTNWIPSFFEGMKSSFEDKVQDDGTYKMEILSNNRNLLNMKNFVSHYNIADFSNGVITSVTHTGDYGWVRLRLKNTYKLKAGTYYLQFKMRSDNYRTGINHVRFETVIDTVTLQYSSILVGPNCTSNYQVYELKFIAEKDFDINYLFIQCHMTASKNFQIKDLMLSRIQSDLYIPYEINKIQFSSVEPLRKTRDVWDKFVFIDGKLMIERNCVEFVFDGSEDEGWQTSYQKFNKYYVMRCKLSFPIQSSWDYRSRIKSNYLPSIGAYIFTETDMDKYIKGISSDSDSIMIGVPTHMFSNLAEGKEYLKNNPLRVVTERREAIYEEIPYELQKIILEGYENGTLFFDTNIPPTSTVTYAGETPIVKAAKSNKIEVLSNTEDINENIIPYLMDMDYRVVCLQLESGVDNVSMAKLFGGAYEMLKRDIQSNRLSKSEYGYRLADYFNAKKISGEEYLELEKMIYE